MGHAPNILRNPRKLKELLERQAAESRRGYRVTPSGALETVNTVEGVLARQAVVLGRCWKVEGCSRRVQVDLRYLSEHGFGGEDLFRVVDQYRCARAGGCAVEFAQPTYPGGVPLVLLACEPDHMVRFNCTSCRGEGYAIRASRAVEQLLGRGRADALTIGAFTIARQLRRRCACGGREWTPRLEQLRS